MTRVAAAPPAQKWMAARLGLVALIMSGLFAAIAAKAWNVQIRDHERMTALGHAQYLHELELPAPRGGIVDRNGVELAVSIEVQSVFANPREVTDAAAAAKALAPLLDLPRRELETKLSSGKRFAWLARRVRPETAKAVRALKLPGVGLSPEAQRFYPAGGLAGPLLGVAGLDGRGLEGVELALDEHLSGQRAMVPVLRDGRGAVLLSGWEEADHHATAGKTVVLTIDRFVQFTAERALADAMTENKAKAGLVVVLDARSGEVLAMASSPTFDPNGTGHRGDARNRPVTDSYEIGSGMKVFTVAAALDAGIVRADELIGVEGGRIMVARKAIADTHFEKEYLSIGEIIKFSSNVGVAKIARRMGKELMVAAFARFGFATKTDIELPGEQQGTIRAAARWGERELATKSFGYGLRATPLQLAAALGALARGGEWIAPRVVREVRGAGGEIIAMPQAPRHQVVSPETARAVMAMMETVMEKGGTGEKLRVPGFRVAGKTGTAYKVDPATKKYSSNRYLSSFIGVAPADDPRLIIVVMIDEPSAGKHYGGVVAGPVFVRIAVEGLKYLGVPATEPIEPVASAGGGGGGAGAKAAAAAKEPAEVAVAAPPVAEPIDLGVDADESLPPAGPGEDIVVIPDFSGMSAAQAVSAARAAGVKLDLGGSGRVVEQYPPPGRALKSITCRITLNPG